MVDPIAWNLRAGVGGLVLALALLVGSDARAIPVEWTLSGVFDDGGSVNGSFVYDADSDAYRRISIKTTAGSRGSSFFGVAYDAVDSAASTADLLAAFAVRTGLELGFADPLSNQGGDVDLASGFETFISGPDQGATRLLTTGRAVGVPVPEPTAACLLGLGLIGLAAERRARR